VSDESHFYGDGHEHDAAQNEAIAQRMRDEAPALEAAADAETEQRAKLLVPVHQFTVTLGKPAGGVGYGWAPEYDLACPGEPATSLCHWWRDVEGDPTTYAAHEECSILDWFTNDPGDFLDGYTGPRHDGITSGPVDIVMWGEDGFEWYYAPDPDGQFERERVKSAIAPYLTGTNIQTDALVDDIMAELAGENE
jgi:hypothetical protein